MLNKRFRVSVVVGYHFSACDPDVVFEYKDYYFNSYKRAVRFSERKRKRSRFVEIIPEHRTYMTEIPEDLPF